MEQNKRNFIPPTSRMTNYVVLRFGDANVEPRVSFTSRVSLCWVFGRYICAFLRNIRVQFMASKG